MDSDLSRESSAEPVVTLDGAGRIVAWNPAAATLFDLGRGRSSGEPLETVVGTTEPAVHWKEIRAAVADSGIWHREVHHILASGDRQCWRWSASAHRRDAVDGGDEEFVVVLRNDARRRQAVDALRTVLGSIAGVSGPEVFDTITLNLASFLGVNVVVVGEIVGGGRVSTLSMRVDGTLARQLTYSLTGAPCDVVTREGFSHYPEGVRERFPQDLDLQRLGAEGYVGLPLRDREDRVIGVLCALSRQRLELTTRAREVMEIVVGRAGVEIERMQTERRRRSLERRVFQTSKMEALGTLAGGIAHDFNNLMGGIRLQANLLQEDHGPEDRGGVFEKAEAIEAAANRAADLTDKLLAFARRGKQRSASVDMHEVAEEIADLLEQTSDRKVEVRLREEAPGAVVMGDPNQLRQVVLSLCVNARDAMPDGGVLSVTTSAVEFEREQPKVGTTLPPGSYLSLCVADTGIGIRPDLRDRVFEPFFSTSEKGDRTGMGLPAVLGIIRNHGGAVEVRSQVGEGSAFTVYVPLRGRAVAPRRVRTEEPAVEGAGRVLLVDDEAFVRYSAERVLMRLGYEVVTARNGREAVNYFMDHSAEVDLVLLDLTMPVMDGARCFKELKELSADVRVLIATGHARDGAAQRLLDEGAVGFVKKPFSMAELSHRVSEALRTD